MCGRPRGYTAAECVAAIEALECDVAAQVVQCANCNGKTALHFAAQNRQSSDCVLVCEALIRRGAVVNATTDRGHTPLIYAAGRGRDEAVSLLLDHGANPRVICVTGHTAAQMGVGHVYEDCIELLEAAEQSSQQEWLDFRRDPGAVDAHVKHCKSCPSCRVMAAPSLADTDQTTSSVKAAIEEMLQITEAVARLAAVISQKECNDTARHVLAVSQALVEGQMTAERLHETRTGKPRTTRYVQEKTKGVQHEFKVCLAPLPPGAPHRLKISTQSEQQQHTQTGTSLAARVVRSAIEAALFCNYGGSDPVFGDATVALATLIIGACGEKILRQVLKAKGIRDRRIIRPLLAEVLAVFKTVQGLSLLRHTSVRSLVAAAEPHLAAEILMLRSETTYRSTGQTETADSLAEQRLLWKTLVAEFSPTSNYGANYMNGKAQAPEVVWLSGKQVRKREGGLIVAMLLRLLRFAWAMRQDKSTDGDSRWQSQLIEVCDVAKKGGGMRRLDLLITSAEAEDLLPSDAVKDLRMQITRLSSFISRAPAASKSPWRIGRGSPKSDQNDHTAILNERELEQYTLESSRVTWIGCNEGSRAETLRSLLRFFKDLAADRAARQKDGTARLMIGIDTEWGKLADQVDADNGGTPTAAPATMQLAVRRSGPGNAAELQPEMREMRALPVAWVIDCSKPSPELRQLTSWLLGMPTAATEPGYDNSPNFPILIGFAFNHDISRLITLSGQDAPPTTGVAIIDLQTVATKLAYGQMYGRAASAMMMSSEDKHRWNTPGLGLVCATFLRKRLDKAEQCSDWDRRPLSESQIAYAAADAAVLVDIADEMQLVSQMADIH